MKQIVEKFLENMSTKDCFQFGIRCEECGSVYSTAAEHFSKAETAPQSRAKQIIYDALYEQEMAMCRHRAVCRLAEYINLCPVCKRIVCNCCFLICEDLDMCVSCASSLEEKGVPVYQGLTENII